MKSVSIDRKQWVIQIFWGCSVYAVLVIDFRAKVGILMNMNSPDT